jgi:hypothetical protein
MLEREISREADGASTPVHVAFFRCPRARRHCVVLLRRAVGHRRRVSPAAVRVCVVRGMGTSPRPLALKRSRHSNYMSLSLGLNSKVHAFP